MWRQHNMTLDIMMEAIRFERETEREKEGWQNGSSSKVPALQVLCPEFKSNTTKKKEKKRFKDSII
jgi:hypothetical protein